MINFEPKRILCPVDFSEQSAAALRVAGGMAKAVGAELIILHVQHVEAPVYFTAAQAQTLKAQFRRNVRAAKHHANEFCNEYLSEPVKHSVMVLEGDPVSAILKAQKDLSADLVAMGTHGRGGLAHVRLGSISESVLRQAEVPILTVGPRTKYTPALGSIRRVLCPVNYSPLAQTTLEHAAALAARTGAELIVAHIEENPGGKDEQGALEQLCNWVPANIRARCAVKEVVKQGRAAEQIVAEAKKSRADLLVMGAQPRSLLGASFFGSTTELVIRSSPCPVLSIIGKR
ncbi:MAG: universal stress protein [Terriglobia bacterium]|jgi:nucleotide-binding universal stress UspA family protein